MHSHERSAPRSVAPGPLLEHPVRGHSILKPRAPSVVSGARHRFRGASHGTSLQIVLLECRPTRSRSPFIRQRRSFQRIAASFGLGALSVRALSSTHRRDAEDLPSDFCHPILSTQTAPVLQSSEEALRLAPDFSEGPAGSRQSSPLRRDRSSVDELLARRPRDDLHL